MILSNKEQSLKISSAYLKQIYGDAEDSDVSWVNIFAF